MGSSEPRAGEVLEVGARLAELPSQQLVASAFAAELESQRGLAYQIGLADLAHTVALVEHAVIPSGQGRKLLDALLWLHEHPEALVLDAALGDLYTNREAWLRGRTPAVAWLGAGRARREATTTAFHLTVRQRLLGLAAALIRFGRAVVERAADLRDALAPDYTYLQAGQPTSFGHTLLTTAPGVLRDLSRVRSLFKRVDRSPAGCGSANGSRLHQDRARLAALLGFAAVVEHARDAMWQADLPIESMAVVVAALVTGDRLAEDLLFFSAAELGFIELSDAHARASKVMPQKKNPYALAYVRASANRAIGLQAAMAAAGRTPSGQLDNRMQAYGDIPKALTDASGALDLLGTVVTGMRFRPERGKECLTQSFTAATDLAEVLVLETGLDFRTAHRIVGLLARELAEAGRPSSSLRAEELAAAAKRVCGEPVWLEDDALSRALDPVAAVGARTDIGCAGAQAVDDLVRECRAGFGEHEAWRVETEGRVARAEAALLERARELAAPP